MNDVSSEMSVSLGTLRPLTPDIAEFVAEVRFGSLAEFEERVALVRFTSSSGYPGQDPKSVGDWRWSHPILVD
jgi:hypothetical protein